MENFMLLFNKIIIFNVKANHVQDGYCCKQTVEKRNSFFQVRFGVNDLIYIFVLNLCC